MIESNESLGTEQLQRFDNLIYSIETKLGKSSPGEYEIISTNPEPFKLGPYRISP